MVSFMIPGLGSQKSLSIRVLNFYPLTHPYSSLFIFWFVKKKVRFIPYLGSYCQQCSLYLSVVLLGLLIGIFPICHQWIHRQSCQLWPYQRP